VFAGLSWRKRGTLHNRQKMAEKRCDRSSASLIPRRLLGVGGGLAPAVSCAGVPPADPFHEGSYVSTRTHGAADLLPLVGSASSSA
jgi:hypothetical protein